MHADDVSAGPHADSRLNFDILRLVCDYLTDIPDVLSFSLTCSALTEDALRRRLRMAPVDLSNAEVISSFHAFIFSNQPSRAQCIFGLMLPSQYDYPEAADGSDLQDIDNLKLVAILKAALHIQYLYFPTSISSFVFEAMVQLTTVRELKVFAATNEDPLRRRLHALRYPLRSLHVVGSEQVGDTISASFLHDHLSHFAPTLEFLDLDHFELNMLPSSVTTQFAAVRSLKLQVVVIRNIHPLDVLLGLFPKLDNTLDLGALNMTITAYECPAFHERSKEIQKRHAWSSLDRLVCDDATAYLLALQCPIRRMDIEILQTYGSLYLSDTLCYNPPRLLHVSTSVYDGLSVLDRLFPPEAAERLTHLVVFADAGRRYRRGARRKANNVQWDRFTNRLITSIKNLRLTHLRIVFHSAVDQCARRLPPNKELMKTAYGIDLRFAAARFVDAMPTIQYLFLTAWGHEYVVPQCSNRWPGFPPRTLHRWLSSKAWRVVHDVDSDLHPPDSDKGLGSCVELSREAAESIIDREELELSLHEEGKVRECAGSEVE